MNLKEKIINGWEISAKGYDSVVQNDFELPGREIWQNLILDKAPVSGKMKILDVGTGPGVFATILSMLGHDVIGIDISQAMLDAAKKNSDTYGVTPQYIRMDSEQLQFPNNTFDMIVSRNVVWIMEDPEAVYADWLRILKPGGRIVAFDIGHEKDDYLTDFDKNHTAYVESYKQNYGKAPRVTFAPEKYEEARGWKRELKLSYEKRPEWDVRALEKLGFRNIHWDNIAEYASYTEDYRIQYKGKNFFRLCGDK
ncbi:MAG: class I SAM-dependent methyltransferase [Oscillospiraceae bacterium]|nr:class I SAM-dependent methyltransferase [Oscillospiraceae bacterium]